MLSDETSPLVIPQLTPFNRSHATDVPTPAVSSWHLGQLFIGDKVKFVYIKEFTLAHNYNTLFLIKKDFGVQILGEGGVSRVALGFLVSCTSPLGGNSLAFWCILWSSEEAVFSLQFPASGGWHLWHISSPQTTHPSSPPAL